MAAALNQNDATLEGSRGPGGAFEELIREHQRMIHSLCYRMTGSLADAEDLAQETFIQAFQHRDSFRGEAHVSSWLYRIAVNLCLNWRKRASRREQIHREWGQEERVAEAEHPRHAQQIQEALLKLNPKQRAAIVLTVYDGLNHAEAAKALGCAETTVSWRLFAARRALKKLLRNLDRREGA
jgi:RNA polymerase sigma-70 factor (ECF subfamily)